MPVYLVLLTGWFKVFGFGLLALRSFTIWCGLAALLAWFSIVHKLTHNPAPGILGSVLIAIDYGFALRVSEGRMDALGAAFGFGGIAAYLYLRERHFKLAILLSQAAVTVSGLTHPNAGMLAFAGLLFVTFYYDAGRVRFVHLLIALVPYVVGAVAWGAYIAQDVEAFRAQFVANARFGGRLRTFSAPFETLKREIVQRYLSSLGGWTKGSFTIQNLKLLIPVSYALGTAGVCFTSALRRNPANRILLLLTGIYAFVLTFSDGRKSPCYLIHIIPLYATLLAIWILWLWTEKKVPRLRSGPASRLWS
jgi:hypothetical protein